jgi:hypothetical protein
MNLNKENIIVGIIVIMIFLITGLLFSHPPFHSGGF